MGELKRVAVKIQGKEYFITGTEEENYIQKLAYYIDRKLTQVSNSNSMLSSDMVAILTAMNIADELLKAVDIIEKLKKKMPMKDFEVEKYLEDINKIKEEEKISNQEMFNKRT
jgi:cell division protein ZapA